MVTTTADLTVIPSSEGMVILYNTDNAEYAYEGYYEDYDKRAITSVLAPYVVLATAQAYMLVHSDEAFRVFIQPT